MEIISQNFVHFLWMEAAVNIVNLYYAYRSEEMEMKYMKFIFLSCR